MDPIRGIRKRVVIHDWDGNERTIGQEDTAHIVTDDGALQSFHTSRGIVFSCGCVNQPVAGFCSVCCAEGMPGTVCDEHFGLCLGCSKSLCPKHSVFPEGAQKKQIRYCMICYPELKRRHRLKQITHLLLLPFIKFKDEGNAKG